MIKLSPDINETEISPIVELVKKYKNSRYYSFDTTDSNRESLVDFKKNETGWIIGTTAKRSFYSFNKKIFKETKGKIQIIGVGGIDTGKSAFEKITAGADAVQLYTGMVFKGPGVVKNIKKELISIFKRKL